MHFAYDKISYIFDEFDECTHNKFTGVLDVVSSSQPHNHRWRFFFRLGRITWATGGQHPYRRLRRQLLANAPQIPFNKIQFKKANSPLSHWDFQLLFNCFKKGLIEPKQLEIIADSVIKELLFDVIQRANTEKLECTRNPQIALDLPITFTSTKAFLRRADSEWQGWYSAGLEVFYPDLAPVICDRDSLQKAVSAGVYQSLDKWLDGQSSLRDLAVNMKQDLVKVTASLRSHILKQIIELVPLTDLSPLAAHEVATPRQVASHSTNASGKLIACIDDSPQICQMMEKIIVSNGMRFVKIQDAIQALPILIQNKPDFIFLDLIMPVVNGYEICSQIRRISSFADIPVVILTSSDGLFDRVRAKAVGSTDFMSKPIIADKVLSAINKYLPNESMNTYIQKITGVQPAM